MKIIEWNLHFAGDKSIEKLPQFVFEYLASQKADIIVLTETVKGKAIENLLEKLGTDVYRLFFSKSRDGDYANGVCIFAKTKMKPKFISDGLDITDDPDMVHIEVQENYKKYNIIGNRIRVDTKFYQEPLDYIFRNKQSDNLLSYALQFQNVIVIGDQNTGTIHCRDDLNSHYRDYQSLYKGKSREYYNAHLLKEKAEEKGFTLKEPQGMNASVGIIFEGGNSRFIDNWKTKIDLVYCSDNIEFTAEYKDDFLNNNQTEYYALSRISGNGKRICGHGCPDHAVLMVDLYNDKTIKE